MIVGSSHLWLVGLYLLSTWYNGHEFTRQFEKCEQNLASASMQFHDLELFWPASQESLKNNARGNQVAFRNLDMWRWISYITTSKSVIPRWCCDIRSPSFGSWPDQQIRIIGVLNALRISFYSSWKPLWSSILSRTATSIFARHLGRLHCYPQRKLICSSLEIATSLHDTWFQKVKLCWLTSFSPSSKSSSVAWASYN